MLLKAMFWSRKTTPLVTRLPQVVIKVLSTNELVFTAPSSSITAAIINDCEERVGRVCYAPSPLADRVYLFEIEISAEHRRRGYATALLWQLAQTYSQPITPIKELFSAHGFWTAARELTDSGIIVTEYLSDGDIAHEADRWAHLRPAEDR